MKYGNITLGQLEAIINNLGGEEGALKFLRGELVVQPVVIPELDFIVRVNRSVKPTYTDSSKKPVHPELELAGPAEYDLSKVEQWLSKDQECHFLNLLNGKNIYQQLQNENVLASCLNLQDGFAIQKKGIAVFRRLFAGKEVFLWGSVVENYYDGGLLVPYLLENGGKVVLRWRWLNEKWNSRNPALRFNNK